MAVCFGSEGCGGRESDKNSDFEPPMGFVSWSAESTCVHNRSHIAALAPSSLCWDRIYLEINRE